MKCKKGYKLKDGKCVKTNPRSKNNKTNSNTLWIIVTIFGILIIAGIVFYGGKAGWFRSLTVVEDTDLINYLNLPETISTTCSLSISPNSIWVGDRTTGTIVDGKNKLCHVYVLQDGDWLSAYQGYTDSNGVLTDTRTMNLPGDYIFRAICDLNEDNRVDTGDCLTNQADLTVIPRPDEGICTETDGGNVINVPGITTFDGMGYMDVCVATDSRVVHEYWCEGDTLQEGNFMCPTGSTCFQTRSGAYCLAPHIWNVGDVVSSESGSGTMPESGGVGFEFHDLMDFEVVLGGERRLGAKIYTNWNYVDPDMCFGMVQQEGMEWMFTDSDSVEWHVVDLFPQAHSVDLCPLNWDGTNLWFLDFWKTQNILGCDITYNWDVEIYVCE